MISFTKPTNKQIEAVLPLLSSPQHEAYFFSRLENPLWIVPLAQRNVFKYPPSAEHVKGGGIRFPNWPPSRYLARMASLAPKEVANVFAEIDTDNSSVIGDMLDAANAMPPLGAVALAPSVCRAAEAGQLWIHFKDASDLCMKLIDGGEVEAAYKLAQALFTPKFESEEEPSRRDAHWYKEGLTAIAPALAKSTAQEFLPVLCDWLNASVKARKLVDAESGDDYSYSWRPAIEEHEQNHDFIFASVMVGIVRAALEVAVRNGVITLNDALSVLEKQRFLVFKRMRLHLLAEFGDQQPELARQIMLNRELFDDYEFKHEYAMLMGRRWNLLEDHQQNDWLGWVDAGPDMSDYDESIQKNLGREATDEDRQGRIHYWQYEKLHWIRNHLSGQHRCFYDEMRKQHGEPELADLNIYSGRVRHGHESPMTMEQLAEMTFDQVVDAVAVWKQTESSFMGPSIEGLASTFGQYLATNPTELSSKAAILKGRPAIFVRGFIGAMTDAVKAGTTIDVPAVVDLCQWVVNRPVGERTVPKQNDEGLVDENWQWTRDQISEFVKTVCKAQTDAKPAYPLHGIRDPIWKLIDVLCRDRAKSNVVRDIAEDDPRIHDYLNLGINSPRGKAVEAALEYARWVGNHMKTMECGQESIPNGFDSMPEVRNLIEWQLKSENRTFEAMSILGSKVGVIYWIDKDWLNENSARLFNLAGIEQSPPAAEGWAAWNAFLVWVRPHIEYYRRFRSQFACAVEQSAAITLTDRPREQPMHHLGEHLMLLYGRGQLGFDEDGGLLLRFIDSANADVRRHTIGFVGTSLEHADDVPEDVLQRFMSLWDLYWAGPGPHDAAQKPDAWLFGMWFACGKFPAEWSIEQLRQFVEVAPTAEPDHAIVEHLAEIASVNILAATEILDLMVRGDKEGWRVSGWTESAEKILALAMTAGGEAKSLAESLINHLGRCGHIEFGKLLRPSE